MTGKYVQGHLVAAAAQNIEIGFVPSYVRIFNVSNDTETIYEGWQHTGIHFDNGGSTTADREIKKGFYIRTGTNNVRGVVSDVVLESGSWAGGNASGWLILEPGTLEGTTVADNEVINASPYKGQNPSVQYALADTHDGERIVIARTFDLDTELGLGAANVTITPYYGTSGGNGAGFTIGSALGTNGDLLFYQAWGEGVG